MQIDANPQRRATRGGHHQLIIDRSDTSKPITQVTLRAIYLFATAARIALSTCKPDDD